MEQKAITQRIKFLIKHIIGTGLVANQEELGRYLGINNKSYFSQLIAGQRNNENLIKDLLNIVPHFNKEWLYDESIESPFLEVRADVCLVEKEATPEEIIQKLQQDVELLKKDVKYYADIAEMRLQTIDLQSKLIAEMEKNR